MAKKRFYAIKKGKGDTKNKIVETWSECKDLVLGYPAEYKGFATKEEAEIYLGIKNISNLVTLNQHLFKLILYLYYTILIILITFFIL